MALLYVLYGITAIFFLILFLGGFLHHEKRERICSICFASSITWISLLVLYHLGKFSNILIIALLMGMTLLGIFYIFERKVKKELTFFRLPFLLTLIISGYYLLTLENVIKDITFIAILWIIFSFIYHYRENFRFKKFVDKIIECCKKW